MNDELQAKLRTMRLELDETKEKLREASTDLKLERVRQQAFLNLHTMESGPYSAGFTISIKNTVRGEFLFLFPPGFSPSKSIHESIQNALGEPFCLEEEVKERMQLLQTEQKETGLTLPDENQLGALIYYTADTRMRTKKNIYSLLNVHLSERSLGKEWFDYLSHYQYFQSCQQDQGLFIVDFNNI